MKSETLALLGCPSCKGDLILQGQPLAASIEAGLLCCTRCERRYSIENGIPQFIDVVELEGSNKRFSQYYNRLAPFYALFTKVAFLAFGGERKARMEILERLELNHGRVLEVSIGPGVNLPYLFESSQIGEVYGLDISAGQLTRCQNLLHKRNWSVELFLGNAEALPFKSAVFDSVFHIGGINFFNNKKQAINEMIRVAKPGTNIVIADENERLARLFNRSAGKSSVDEAAGMDVAVSVDLVPKTMEAIRVNGIWRAHGEEHGYCLEFRKPAEPQID